MRGMLNWLNRLAGGDFEAAAADSPRRRAKLLATVGLVAFSLLTLELLLARMYPFFLGNISAFLAIPVTMFGLSVGALVPGPWSDPSASPDERARALVGFRSFVFLRKEFD